MKKGKSELFINTVLQNGKTILSDCFFTSPVKIAKPFYREDGFTEIMIMCASPGILAGDKYDMRFTLSERTKTVISEQSYRKLYNTVDGASYQNTQIQVGEDAVFYYVPYPVIPFAGSRFYARTDISLCSSSKLIFGDIFTCGRHGMGEQFAFNEYMSRTTVTVDGKLVFLDNCKLTSGEADFSGLGFFEGYTCQGLFYLHGFDTQSFESLLPTPLSFVSLPCSLFTEIQGAISKSYAGLTVRLFGNSANSLYQYAVKLFSGVCK